MFFVHVVNDLLTELNHSVHLDNLAVFSFINLIGLLGSGGVDLLLEDFDGLVVGGLEGFDVNSMLESLLLDLISVESAGFLHLHVVSLVELFNHSPDVDLLASAHVVAIIFLVHVFPSLVNDASVVVLLQVHLVLGLVLHSVEDLILAIVCPPVALLLLLLLVSRVRIGSRVSSALW